MRINYDKEIVMLIALHMRMNIHVFLFIWVLNMIRGIVQVPSTILPISYVTMAPSE